MYLVPPKFSFWLCRTCDVGNMTDDDGSVAQLTQASESALELLTQQHPEEGNARGPICASATLKTQYLEDKSIIDEDGLILEHKGKQQALAFFHTLCDPIDLKVGRGLEGEDVDIVVPIKDGWCGVSRLAFRILRSDKGHYSI